MPGKLKLRIYADGRVKADIQGIKGKKCTNYIKMIEELLEAEAVDSEYTSEYYEEDEVKVCSEVEVNVGEVN
ncbi:DUF2997 domain-containing protein [Clostridium sp.]|uniref:DUF2997 domain-containing protein n=1 Tax=Clostridium sp. TaxID=1506 RepID=UPI002FC78A97